MIPGTLVDENTKRVVLELEDNIKPEDLTEHHKHAMRCLKEKILSSSFHLMKGDNGETFVCHFHLMNV